MSIDEMLKNNCMVTSIHLRDTSHSGDEKFRRVSITWRDHFDKWGGWGALIFENGKVGIEGREVSHSVWWDDTRRVPQAAIMDYFLQLFEVPWQEDYNYTEYYPYDIDKD